MMLANNKYERYQQSLPTTMTTAFSSSASSSPTTCGGSSSAAAARAERESIHSGQFMVSHFEAEEAQDDLDDSEVKMLDPEDPSLSKPDEPSTCTEVQLYVPRKVAQLQQQGYVNTGVGLITSHLEIETSLTKLFKCMNLAYSQKLTSPKWNHFKGVRLRWKDKIRLNNVIWRCWHMQFILKRRTPVCQFASPLDVDIHSNPQTVVLEGKYWKRQLAVIKAEYRKWRRHFKSKVTGCLTYDTKSEFDFLEWSPLNDRNLMISDDWTSDTLFSAIDGPFPFPDSREIARGAGIADFIQPSLGPLQPNLEDIDITFADLIQTTRLAPVPEEGTDEMLKNVDYGFSSIMGAEQMDSSSIMDEMTSSGNNMPSMSSNEDANMLELNTPLNSMQYTDIEQEFTTRGNQNSTSAGLINANVSGNHALLNASTNRAQGKHYDFSTGVLDQNADTSMSLGRQQQQQQQHHQQQNLNDFSGKSVIKGRIAKNFQRPFRREPHNYDKAQPTLHQTTIYQQMLAEQQKNQQHQQHHAQQSQSHHQPHHLQPISNFQQQQQLHFAQTQFPQASNSSAPNLSNKLLYSNKAIGTGYNAAPSVSTAAIPATPNNNLLPMPAASNKIYPGQNVIVQQNTIEQQQQRVGQQQKQQQQQQQQQQSGLMLNIKIEPSNNDMLSRFNLTSTGSDMYNQSSGSISNAALISSNAYKPYPNAATFKKSSSTGTFVNIRGTGGVPYGQPADSNATQQQQLLPMHATTQSLQLQIGAHSSSTHAHITTHAQLQSPNQASQLPKEMFRSNSLPLNATLQTLETVAAGPRPLNDSFVVPKYHAKCHKSRTRSNSMHQAIISVSSNGSSNGNNNTGNSSNSSQSVLVTPAAGRSSNLFIAPSQLQTATSDPMLNSTLAQLLTANSRMAKQQSSSTSAISTPNVPQHASRFNISGMATPSVLVPTPSSNKTSTQPMPTVAVNTNIFMSPTQSSSSSSSLINMNSMSSSPTGAHEFMLQQQRQKHQQHVPMQKMQHPQQHHHQQQQHQPKSPKKSTSLPTPVASIMLHSPPQTKTLSYPLSSSAQATVSHLSLSPESFHEQDSPLSPTHSLKFPRDNQRRAGHIHAEQKRRYNIKNGFDLLHSLIPQLQQNPNAKLSKAAMLQKGAEHIRHLCHERNQLKEKMEMLRQERDAFNASLTHLHSILPANGAPVTRQGTEHVRQLYEQYVRYRTMDNWKFWILGLMLEPLLTSYTSSVSSASMEEMRRTVFLWVDQHCSLIDLRPAVSNKLKYLSMKTDILSEPPSTLQEEVAKAVKNSSGQHPNLHGT